MYTCPMHPEVRESSPGVCPKCGMDLVLANAVGEHGHGPVKQRSRRNTVLVGLVMAAFVLLVIADVSGRSPLHILPALSLSFTMFWDTLWALVLGFGISAAVQAVVSRSQVSRLLPDASPRSLTIACGLGAASSSCSYAATAIARSLFRKGADFTSAIAFEFASTNLVIELGIILWVLIGWQFTLAEFLGGVVMIAFLALLFRLFLTPRMVADAKIQADANVQGAMEGHAAMDMTLKEGGSVWQKLLSAKGFTAISSFFFMDVYSIWKDIAAGFLISGALGAWVPHAFWQSFFLVGQSPFISAVWGAFVGPIVSMLSFVCSIGNVPLAAVLWNGGISFAGVISFIFADLIIFPILNIYRKYYGSKMAAFLFGTSYAAMALAGLVIEYLFNLFHLIPSHHVAFITQSISFDYTAVLNGIFLIAAVALLIRFKRTGGFAMLQMMR